MLVRLKDLKPNPHRRFSIDPIDESTVAELAKSIKEDGFWGGVVCRETDDGDVEIAAGHHRVEAAMRAGIREADVFVGNFDDRAMIRVYARENATQRGNSGAALAGSVAAAAQLLLKAALSGNVEHISRILDISRKAAECLMGNAQSAKGLGEPAITQLLKDVPGMTEYVVQQQLANLKTSGEYAKIVEDVRAELEREHGEQLKALERAEREAQKAVEEAERAEKALEVARAEAKRKRDEAHAREVEKAQRAADLAEATREELEAEAEQFGGVKKLRDSLERAASAVNNQRVPTFDFEGVAKHLTNAHVIDVFRRTVTGAGVAPLLPVNKQAALAAELVRSAKADGRELTGAYVKEKIVSKVIFVKQQQHKLSKEEKQQLERQSWESAMRALQDDFARSVRSMFAAADKIVKHLKDRPRGLAIFRTAQFNDALKEIGEVAKMLKPLR